MTARPGMSESQIQATLLDALSVRQRGMAWLVHHDTDPRRSLSGGWPDVVALHPPTRRCLVVECKSAAGAMRGGQLAWLLAWQAVLAPGSLIGVMRPDDLQAVLDWIARPGATPPQLL